MTAPPANPGPVWDVINGYAAYGALTAGLDLGLFDALSDAEADAGALAQRIGVPEPEHAALLADTLVSLGFLATEGARYRLTPVAERYLVTASPHQMAALVRLSPGPREAWADLAGTFRRGASRIRVDSDPAAFYPALVTATAPTQRAVAAAVAARLDAAGQLPEAPTVVDLGAGSAAWSAAFLDLRQGATAVAVDLPEVVATTSGLAGGLGDRVTVVAGDYLEVELPTSADVVVLGHVLRAEPVARARALLHRAIGLAGGTGVVVGADYPRPDPPGPDEAAPDRVLEGARHELLLSLTMLAATGGCGVSEQQLQAWCAEAGAAVVERLEPLPRQHVFLIRSDTSSRPSPAKESTS
jgi:hypothetical protein